MLNWKEILIPIFIGLLLTELSGWLPKLSERLIKRSADLLPKRNKERQQEWLANLDEVPGQWSKLIYSLSCMCAAEKISLEENTEIAFAGLILSLGRMQVLQFLIGLPSFFLLDQLSYIEVIATFPFIGLPFMIPTALDKWCIIKSPFKSERAFMNYFIISYLLSLLLCLYWENDEIIRNPSKILSNVASTIMLIVVHLVVGLTYAKWAKKFCPAT